MELIAYDQTLEFLLGFRVCDFSHRFFLPTGTPFLSVRCCATVFRHRSAMTASAGSVFDMGWPDLLSKLAVMMMRVMDNLVSPKISPR
jgi:hypothetical protein